MLSHVEMREASVWLQTDTTTKVRVAYAEEGKKNALKWSNLVQTNNDYDHTANITLDAVEPGKHYNYRIELNGKLQTPLNTFATPTNFQGHTPPPDLRIALGGAHYVAEDGFEPPYQTLGGGYRIFSTILEADPDLMIWTGNTAHLRASDWSSQSGTLKRFSKARSVAELQPLLASIPHYATWSNSDYSTSNAG
ncbi:MAG TPA: phosphodiesterase, partial [Opitutae bacterium]|nr:phosphodiesterase [Opitutae bacterium]